MVTRLFIKSPYYINIYLYIATFIRMYFDYKDERKIKPINIILLALNILDTVLLINNTSLLEILENKNL